MIGYQRSEVPFDHAPNDWGGILEACPVQMMEATPGPGFLELSEHAA